MRQRNPFLAMLAIIIMLLVQNAYAKTISDFKVDGDAESEVEQNEELEVVELKYDDGTPDGWNNVLSEGDYESIMFQMEHPACIKALRMMFGLGGEIEIHLWGDAGGNNPDFSDDLIVPIEYRVAAGDRHQWLEFDLSDQLVDVAALKYLHVGTRRKAGGTGMAFDTSNDFGRSFVYHPDEPGVKYVMDNNANFMVQVELAYHDKQQTFLFEEIAEIAGISRVAWGDYDNDGDDDMLVSAAKLYRNNGDGTFTDVSESAGIEGISGSGMWADYDNDGYLDYYAFSSGATEEDRDRLVHNNGDGTFSAVNSNNNVPFDYDPTQAVGWADYDHDGWVDLYVANYEVEMSQCTQDRLWKNLGGGLFKDVTENVGIGRNGLYCGRGVAWGDYNNDGLIDLYVSNYRLDPNFLYENRGDGTFREMAFAKHLAGTNVRGSYGHSIGSVWGDFDNDLDLDLFIGNLAHPRLIDISDKSMLFVNSGAPDFEFENIFGKPETGMTYCETHSDPLWFDYDNDGYLDLMLTAIYTEFASFLYHNEGNGTFKDVSYETGLWVLNGLGTTAVDVDRDGDLDVSTRAFFKNNLANGNHWLQVKLKGKRTNTFGIGCRIEVETENMTLLREVEGGKGTGVQSSMVQHFGLGQDTLVKKLTVKWVDGQTSVLTDLAVDQLLVVEEEGQPVCLNQLGECLSETTLKVCRNWQWTTEEAPDGLVCHNRFFVDPALIVDGDADLELEFEDELEDEFGNEIEEDGDILEKEIETEISDGDEEESTSDGDMDTDNNNDNGCFKMGSVNALVLLLLLGLLYRRIRRNDTFNIG